MTLTEANRQKFDEMASQYDAKVWHKKLSFMIIGEIRDRIDWFGVDWAKENEKSKEVRFLDYACGTGLISRALGPFVTTIRGIDLSSNMAAEYNSRAVAAGLAPEQMSAVQGNLISDEADANLSNPALFNFDVAAVGLGFHHFDDVFLATKRISERLKPGGVFFIVDFLSDKPHEIPPELKSYVKVFGFNQEGMRGLFEGAGLVDFGFSVIEEKAEMEKPSGEKFTVTLFIAKGRKPVL
ncbi:Methyltransferase type 11 [Macrophomina phaseolina MS6]|uniref:Methyltransferase type 11 n=2 Tax=Macrophomina phaseolina TaxID=35725 RepID=K2SMT3_MACPH|nr:Methyltransferase type 11 [Macrophomina phaseolina MS6]KAH7064995.1 S-adenosyl-L-methionine-dependent methyltransferase [Macrophomina phaseolina]